MFPPEQLNEMLSTGKLELDSNNTLMNTLVSLMVYCCYTVTIVYIFRIMSLDIFQGWGGGTASIKVSSKNSRNAQRCVIRFYSEAEEY